MSDFKLVKLLDPQVIVTGGLIPSGVFATTATYTVGDAVSYGGGSYIAIQTTGGNLPTNTTYWQILALQGAAGINYSRIVSKITINTNAAAATGTDYVYLCSGTLTLTMPTVAANVNRYTVKNIGSGIVTISAADTIDGNSTIILGITDSAVDLIAGNSEWNIL